MAAVIQVVAAASGGRQAGTTLYDAILLASDELMKKQSGAGRRSYFMTDGVDNGSKVRLFEAIESAQRADTLVYSIYFTGEEARQQQPFSIGMGGGRHRGGGGYPRQQGERTDGKKILQQISRETGGGYFEVSKKLPIDQIYDRIEEELRNQLRPGLYIRQNRRRHGVPAHRRHRQEQRHDRANAARILP